MLEARGIYERQRPPGGVSDSLLSRLTPPSSSPPTLRHSLLLSFVLLIVLANVLLVVFLVAFIGFGGTVSSLWPSSLTPSSPSSSTPLPPPLLGSSDLHSPDVTSRPRRTLDPLRQQLKNLTITRGPTPRSTPSPNPTSPLSHPSTPSLPLPLPLPHPLVHHHVVLYNHNFDHLPLPTAHKPGESFHFNSLYQALLHLNRSLHLHLHLSAPTSEAATHSALSTLDSLPSCPPPPAEPTSPCHTLLALISHTYDLCPGSDRCRPFNPFSVFQHPQAPRHLWRLVDYWSTPPDENHLRLHPLQHWTPYDYQVNFQSGFLILTALQADLLESHRYPAYDALRLRELFPSSQTASDEIRARILAPAPGYTLKMCFYGVGNIWFSTPRWDKVQVMHERFAKEAGGPLGQLGDALAGAEWMYSGDIHCGGAAGCEWFKHRHLVGPGQYVDWVRHLTTCSLMLATGEPIVSPTPLEAVGNGAVFVDIVDNAHGPVHTHTVHGQSYQSQHPWVRRIVGEEWAKLADWTNEEALMEVVMGAVKEDYGRYERWVGEREKWGKLEGERGGKGGEVDMEGFEYTLDQLAGEHWRVGRIHENFTLETIARRIWENMHDPAIEEFHNTGTPH